MADKKEPKAVKKLAADAAKRQAAKKHKHPPSIGKRIRLVGEKPKPPKNPPSAVIKLISDALKRKDKH